MNDRHRCEISFVARAVYLLVLGGIQTRTLEQKKAFELLAYNAMMEPLSGLTERQAATLRRRVIRMEENTIEPLAGKVHGVRVILILYYFINKLVDDGVLLIPEGSSLALITDVLLALVNTEDEEVVSQMETAKEQADKWLESLRSEGYYL